MTHRIQFNFDVANALVNGAAIPVSFVQQFVQDAYDSFNNLNETLKKLEEKEKEITRILFENEMLKNTLLEKFQLTQWKT